MTEEAKRKKKDALKMIKQSGLFSDSVIRALGYEPEYPPRKAETGHWIEKKYTVSIYECSNCGVTENIENAIYRKRILCNNLQPYTKPLYMIQEPFGIPDYCPCCGADMREPIVSITDQYEKQKEGKQL